MLLRDHLRLLMAPDGSRWKLMLAGLALSAAAAGAAVLIQPNPLSIALAFLAVVAWFAGACAMVGYVRWFFASEIERVGREHAGAVDGKSGEPPRRRGSNQ